MSTTVITTFYDTSRFRSDHSRGSTEEYWDVNIAHVNLPLVVYGDESYIQFIKNNRPEGYLTEYHSGNVTDLRYYKLYYDKVVENREKSWPTRDDRANAAVHVICCSKLDMLKDVANRNPFGTEFFCYCDANIMKKTDSNLGELEDRLSKLQHTFHMVMLGAVDYKLSYEELYSMYRYHIIGMIMTGDKDHVNRVHELFDKELETTTNNGYGHGEEMIFIKIIHKNRDLFTLSYGDYRQCITNLLDIYDNKYYILNYVIRRFIKQGMYCESLDCINKMLTSKNDIELTFLILYEKYLCEYSLDMKDEMLNTLELIDKIKNISHEYIKNRQFYDNNMSYGRSKYIIMKSNKTLYTTLDGFVISKEQLELLKK